MSRTDAAPLRFAFLGCGWATRIHSGVLRAARGVRLAYASRDPRRASALRARFGGHRAYSSYEDALADEGIDAVVVTTPPHDHLALTLRALRNGKHVVVEKPAFARARDVATVRSTAAAAGRQVLIAENYAYKPLLDRLRALLRQGAVGEPRFVQVNALRLQRSSGWRDDRGVGALYEGGIHWVNLLANLGLSIERVTGMRPGPAAGPDRSMLVVVEYTDGPVATLHYSWETPTLARGLGLSSIVGTAGAITFETNGLFVFSRGRRRGFWMPRPADIAGYKSMWTDFLSALRTGAEPYMSLGTAERDLNLVEAIYACLD